MYFYEPAHKYFKNNLDEPFKFISASGVIKKYGQEFDEVYWSLYKSYEFLLYKRDVDPLLHIDTYLRDKPNEPKQYMKPYKKGYTILDYRLFNHLRMYIDENEVTKVQKYILKSWDNTNKISLVKGDGLHFLKETLALTKTHVTNPFTKNKLPVIECNKWISKDTKQRIVDLTNLKPGYYAELILDYDIFLGQSDKLWFEPIGDNQLGFWIDDWKTNKSIDFENQFQNMKFPLHNLQDHNWNHYKIQLSFYIWILIQYGYKYMGSRITHCILDENTNKWSSIPHYFEYMEKEISDVTLDIYAESLNW